MAIPKFEAKQHVSLYRGKNTSSLIVGEHANMPALLPSCTLRRLSGEAERGKPLER